MPAKLNAASDGRTKNTQPVRNNWRAARYAVGALCALAAIYASAVNIQWAEVGDAFRRASLPWTAAAAATVLLTLVLVTFRWGLLVDSGPLTRRWRVLWDSVVLGQAVNILVPLRFGEGVRLAVTSRGLNIPVGRVMVALALERAVDMTAFATIVLALMLSGWIPGAFTGLLPQTVAITIVTLAVVVLVVRFLPAILAWLRRHIGIPASASAWIETQETAIRAGWIDVRRQHRLTITALLSALLYIAAAATNLMVLRAFGLAVPAVAAVVLLLVLQAGTAVVSVPGNIGVFHYLTVVTLAAWGVPRPAALATAIVLHAVTLGPKVLLGAFATTVLRGSLSHGSRS